LVFQVVQTLTEGLGLPDWVPPFALILLLVGLPIVVATAFVQEGLGGREVAASTEPESSTESADTPQDTPAAVAGDGRVRHRLFTWRNAILGGVAAFALLGVVTVGYMAMRTLGIGPAGTLVARGVLEEQSTLLLADFSAEDASLSRAATEAFRVDLGQSSVIKLAQPGFVSGALKRMERDPADGVDRAVGLELAVREGLSAVIVGEITSAGTSYVLTAQVIQADGEAVLVSDRETAADDSEIVPAIDRLSKKLRERIGESLRDLAAGEPLENVTTGNLGALRLYSEALRLDELGERQRAVDVLEEAVAADTAFAMAWRKLGMEHLSANAALGNRTRGIEALGRAYAFRNRLTERERNLATAGYFTFVERDDQRAEATYDRMLDRDPEDYWALNNQALLYFNRADWAGAEELLARATALDSSATHFWNLSVAQARQAKYDDSWATLRTWRRLVPTDAQPVHFSSALAAAERNFEEADQYAREAMEVNPGALFDAELSYGLLKQSAAARGRLAEAASHQEAEMRAAEDRGALARALRSAISRASLALSTRQDPQTAADLFDEALERYPVGEMGALDPRWGRLASLAAEIGRPEQARDFAARWSAADPNAEQNWRYEEALGWIALAEGDPDEARRRFRSVEVAGCRPCMPRDMAAAWAQAGDADSTIVYLEAYVDAKGMFRIFVDGPVLGPTLERLGQLYDEKGDLENALKYYAQFVELWRDADPELQPRVQAAQQRLNEIFAARG
jgi:tetratricopeptide (TPR) repeat protein